MTLNIQGKNSIAFIGNSGCGKTTLFKKIYTDTLNNHVGNVTIFTHFPEEYESIKDGKVNVIDYTSDIDIENAWNSIEGTENTIFVFDNVFGGFLKSKQHSKHIIPQILVSGRHKNITSYIMCQNMNIGNNIMDYMDYVCCFRTIKRHVKHMIKHRVKDQHTKDFYSMYKEQVVEDHDFVFVSDSCLLDHNGAVLLHTLD